MGWRARASWGAAALLAATLAVAVLKKVRDDASAACGAQDAAGCERACQLRVADELGCRGAALLASEEWRREHSGRGLPRKYHAPFPGRALDFYDRGCQLGDGSSCVEAVRWDQAAEDARNLTWRARACALGELEACRSYAVDAVAHSPSSSEAAIMRHCERSRGTPEERLACLEQWRKLAASSAKERAPCDRGEKGACARLGAVLFDLDQPLALQAYASECELLGLSELFARNLTDRTHGLEWYEAGRIQTGAESCGVEFMTAELESRLPRGPTAARPAAPGPAKPPAAPAVTLPPYTLQATFTLEPDAPTLRELLHAREGAALRCLEPRAAGSTGGRTFRSRFYRDRFGDLWFRHVASNLGRGEEACLSQLFSSELPSATGAQKVTVVLTLLPPGMRAVQLP